MRGRPEPAGSQGVGPIAAIKRVSSSLSQGQMNANRILYRLHLSFSHCAELSLKTRLVGSHDLVCHRLAALSIDHHHRLARVESLRIAGQGDDDNPGEVSIG